MDIADPPAPQALEIKFLKETDPDANKMALTTPNMPGRPLARVTNQANTAKITTANRIEVSFRRVEIESGANANSMVVVIEPISREKRE
jgi:hypothetical protein